MFVTDEKVDGFLPGNLREISSPSQPVARLVEPLLTPSLLSDDVIGIFSSQ